MVELKYDRKLKLTKMKDWFNTLFLKGIFSSKKFIYAISSVIVPIIITKLGVDETTATNLFYALITLVLGQGIADINKKK
tara:strand:+ start:5856 stop:6095 length:240 start_codon:yes stop_codon:yes gene_type:complete